MVDQTKVRLRVGAPLRLRIHPQVGKRKFARLPPELDGAVNLGRPQKIGLLRRLGRLRHHCGRTVHVVAPDLVLGAIATLGERFIAANVPLFARLASLSRLGVASPRGATAGSSHLKWWWIWGSVGVDMGWEWCVAEGMEVALENIAQELGRKDRRGEVGEGRSICRLQISWEG